MPFWSLVTLSAFASQTGCSTSAALPGSILRSVGLGVTASVVTIGRSSDPGGSDADQRGTPVGSAWGHTCRNPLTARKLTRDPEIRSRDRSSAPRAPQSRHLGGFTVRRTGLSVLHASLS